MLLICYFLSQISVPCNWLSNQQIVKRNENIKFPRGVQKRGKKYGKKIVEENVKLFFSSSSSTSRFCCCMCVHTMHSFSDLEFFFRENIFLTIINLNATLLLIIILLIPVNVEMYLNNFVTSVVNDGVSMYLISVSMYLISKYRFLCI